MNASSQMPPLLVIDPNKISLYLLNLNHQDGRSKAKLFLGWGFHPSRGKELEKALIEHARPAHLRKVDHSSSYGPRFIFVGPMRAPNGKTPDVTSVWEVLDGTSFGKFITAHPT